MIFKYSYNSPIGTLLIECNEKSLISLMITESNETDSSLIISKTVKWLDNYFAGKEVNINNFIFEFKGTKFQKDVWEELMKIPYGQSTTYGDIANKLAKKYGKSKMSAQAVGQAVGKNPIAIIIPCHRVLGQRRKLTGYAYGLDVKRRLLEIEGVAFKRASD